MRLVKMQCLYGFIKTAMTIAKRKDFQHIFEVMLQLQGRELCLRRERWRRCMPAFNAPTSSLARSLRIKLMPDCSRGVSGRTHNVIESHECVPVARLTCSCKRVRCSAESERGALGKVGPLHRSVHRRFNVEQPRRVPGQSVTKIH